MGNKDVISKSIFQRLVRDFAIYLFDLPLDEVELLDTEKQRVEDRHADLVARVKDTAGQTYILHIEIQNHNDPLMPKRMLRYLADVLLAHPNLSVLQYLVYIGKEGLHMSNGLDSPQLTYRYHTIDMHTVDAQTLLSQDSPDAWVLAILGDFKDSPADELVNQILARLVQRLNEEPPRLREYVSMLEILATNRDLSVNIREQLDMLTIDFEKLPTYQMGMEKGIEKGIERGIEKGKQEGKQVGKQEGAHAQAIEIAKRLLDKGMESSQVAALTDLTVAEVQTLKTPPNA